MTVKELKEYLERLIEENKGDFKLLNDNTLYEIDDSNINIDEENKEIWL